MVSRSPEELVIADEAGWISGQLHAAAVPSAAFSIVVCAEFKLYMMAARSFLAAMLLEYVGILVLCRPIASLLAE